MIPERRFHQITILPYKYSQNSNCLATSFSNIYLQRNRISLSDCRDYKLYLLVFQQIVSLLLGFNVAFNNLRLYHDGACLKQWYFDHCAATQKCHAADNQNAP